MKINEKYLFDANSVEISEDVSNIDTILEYEQILLSISKSLINYRKEKNLTQKNLADTLKVKQSMISKIERGTYNPSFKLLYTISRKLTKSSDLFIAVLKDIIRSLYKSKNINYKMQYQRIETYSHKKDNITYVVPENNDNGGMLYGQFNNTSRLSVN